MFCVFALVWIADDICFFFKQKTAYEMRISDWSSDVCSSDLHIQGHPGRAAAIGKAASALDLLGINGFAFTQRVVGQGVAAGACAEQQRQAVEIAAGSHGWAPWVFSQAMVAGAAWLRGLEAWCIEPSQPSRVIHSSASSRGFCGTGNN